MLRLVIALGLLLVCATVRADPEQTMSLARHHQWVRAALEKLPQTADDRVSDSRQHELDALASSIAAASVNAPRSPIEWAALMLTVGSAETNLAGRLLRLECRLERRECDATRDRNGKLYARAKGWGQVWRNSRNAPLWDEADTIEEQTQLVDAALRAAYFTCRRSGVDWQRGTLNAYRGSRCSATWPGLEARIALWARLVRTAAPKGAS